jgi:DNA repair protein RecO (recombination protein O)
MLTKTQAIVLHSIKYGETKLIVDMFTREFGRLSFIVSIPTSPKGRMKKLFFQPLTLLEIETDFRPKLQLQKLTDVRFSSPFISIPFDSDKIAISLFIAEFLFYALRSEQRNELLYDYLENSFIWLDGQQVHFSNFHLVFLLRLTRFLGFYPNLDDYVDGDYFDLRESVFMRNPPVHRDFLYPEEAQKVQLMMRMDYPTMHLFRMSHSERNRLLELSLKYYRLHLPDFPEMKSIDVLHSLYQ